MEKLQCEYPEGCQLDLWAKIIKAKYIEKQAAILDSSFCVPDAELGGKIATLDAVWVKVKELKDKFLFSSVKIFIIYDIVMLARVSEEYRIITLGESWEKSIPFQRFSPPLQPGGWREDLFQSELLLDNWNIEWEIKGNCEDSSNPCNITSPIKGTCLGIKAYVDIINIVSKERDVLVYGEICELEDDKR